MREDWNDMANTPGELVVTWDLTINAGSRRCSARDSAVQESLKSEGPLAARVLPAASAMANPEAVEA